MPKALGQAAAVHHSNSAFNTWRAVCDHLQGWKLRHDGWLLCEFVSRQGWIQGHVHARNTWIGGPDTASAVEEIKRGLPVRRDHCNTGR